MVVYIKKKKKNYIIININIVENAKKKKMLDIHISSVDKNIPSFQVIFSSKNLF